jgi:hypothetical protein
MSPPPLRNPPARSPVAAPVAAPPKAPPPPQSARGAPPPAPGARPAPAPARQQPAAAAGSRPSSVPPAQRPGATQPPRPGSPAGVARTARIAAAGATGTVGQVIEAVRLMDSVLDEENQVLRRHDAKGAAALQERKLAATRLYHERMRALTRDPDAARTMSPEERTELSSLAHGLDERVRENAILLKATMDAIDRLFGCINQAAQQKAKREVSYSRAGLVAANASPTATSIAFNRTV